MLNTLADRKDLSDKTLLLLSTLSSTKYIAAALQNNKPSLKIELLIVKNIKKISDVEDLVSKYLLSIDSITNRFSEIKESLLLSKFLMYAEAPSTKKDKVFKRYIELSLIDGDLIEFEELSKDDRSFSKSGYIRNNRYNKNNYYKAENFAKVVATSEAYHPIWKHVMAGMNREAFEIFSKQTMKIVKAIAKKGKHGSDRKLLNNIAYEIENVISKYGFDDLSVELIRNFFDICDGNNYDIRYLYPYYNRVGHGPKKKSLPYNDFSYEETVANCINEMLEYENFDFHDFRTLLKPLLTTSKSSIYSNDVPLVLSYFVNKNRPSMEDFESIMHLQRGFHIENEDLAKMFKDEKYVGYYLALSDFNNYGVLELVNNRDYVLASQKDVYDNREGRGNLYFLDLTSDLLSQEEILAMDVQYLSTSFNYRDLVEHVTNEHNFDEIAKEVFRTLEEDFSGSLDSLLLASKNL